MHAFVGTSIFLVIASFALFLDWLISDKAYNQGIMRTTYTEESLWAVTTRSAGDAIGLFFDPIVRLSALFRPDESGLRYEAAVRALESCERDLAKTMCNIDELTNALFPQKAFDMRGDVVDPTYWVEKFSGYPDRDAKLDELDALMEELSQLRTIGMGLREIQAGVFREAMERSAFLRETVEAGMRSHDRRQLKWRRLDARRADLSSGLVSYNAVFEDRSNRGIAALDDVMQALRAAMNLVRTGDREVDDRYA